MTNTAYPTLPEWVDLTNMSDRVNALMRANWALINEAADLLNAGDMGPLTWEALQDIWAETIDIEANIAKARALDDLAHPQLVL
ncbi:hypothetical protein JGU71_28330 [Antrihabitans sp. YC3-6]|uniref:Uncharacterized protein n=1 Tax=Antrihabitans stalagmiti TaxID=2799499 RepID=A0A934NWD2_9NOCA|nr:hypothetical protein [Antrihabitans stalagmiti]MBJ8342804.1 hypothetical protein [Antrihabitans stalagmiti]